MPRVRFAPSPTGFLHLGHLFSAVWTDRAKGAGEMLLRIEDVDLARSKEEYTTAIFEDLAVFGLAWPTPVLRQSTRTAHYAANLASLQEMGLLYRCFCSRKEIAGMGGAPHAGENALYPGTCRRLTAEESSDRAASGAPYAWRLDSAEADRRYPKLEFHDRAAGATRARAAVMGDVVLGRKDTPASYHVAVVSDDALQLVELVTRGVDLFEATHVHRVLQEALGLPSPEYWHHPLMTGPNGQRLAKRHGALPLRELLAQGATPQDLLDAVWRQIGSVASQSDRDLGG